MAASDFLLQIDEVKGESKQQGKEKYIDIESWEWGARQGGHAEYGGGLATGKVQLKEFKFVCKNGTSSAQLFGHVTKGTHISTALLECRKAGGDSKTYSYYTVKFESLIISSYYEKASDKITLLPQAEITFNYKKVTIEYFEQDNKGFVSCKSTNSYNQSEGSS